MNDQDIIGQISNNIIKGNLEASVQQRDSGLRSQPGVLELIRLSMKKNIPPQLISEEALDKAMGISIKEFMEGESFLPKLIHRAKNTSKARDILTDYTDEVSSISKGKVVLATIYGEDSYWRDTIMVILKGIGFEIIDLGNSASLDKVVRSVKNEGPDILVITTQSASILPEIRAGSLDSSIPVIKKLTNKLSDEECRKNVTIMIGGYMAGIESADDIGADHCCGNMLEAVDLFNKLYKLSGESSYPYN